MENKNILLVGVGGQGIITASDIICLAAQNAGLDTKKSEVHGMSQRGGVVTSHVRYGRKVYSPLIESGQADVILAFEAAEALRFYHELKPEGTLFAIPYKLIPPSVSKKQKYPEDPLGEVKKRVKNTFIIDATEIAMKLGNIRLANSVILGMLSEYSGIADKHWEYAIEKRAPQKTVPANLQAFYQGKTAARTAKVN